MIPAKWPHATAWLGGRNVHCLIAKWERHQDTNGYNLLYARIFHIVDGVAVEALVAAERVQAVGKPD